MQANESADRRRRISLAREQRNARGEIVADAIEASLGKLALPSGHRVQFDRRHQLTWFLGKPGPSISWSVRESTPRAAMIDPVEAELRVFLDEPRCVVWLEQVRSGGRVSLLGRHAAWLYASTYEQLLTKAADLLAEGLSPLLAPASLRLAG